MILGTDPAVIALMLFGAAAVHPLLLPRLLTVGDWQVRRPRLALELWLIALFSGLACGLAGVAMLVTARFMLPAQAADWHATLLTVAALVATGTIAAASAFAVRVARPLLAPHHTVATVAPRPLSREERPGFTMVRFAAEEPVAYSIGGRRPKILVSTGLEILLTRDQLQAVLAHEYAHLRGRHSWAAVIAELLDQRLPVPLPGSRDFRRAVLLLVELAADDDAAHHAGAVHLANALSRVGAEIGDVSLELRAMRLTMRRWPLASACIVPEPIRI